MNNRNTNSINYKGMLVGVLALFASTVQGAASTKPNGENSLQIQPNFKTLDQYNLTSVSEMQSAYPTWLANSALEISGYDLTTEPHWSCARKRKGATPGEICTTIGTRQIDEPGTKYFLKKVNYKNPFQLLTNNKTLNFDDPHTLLMNHYFLHFCQSNWDVITPQPLFIVKHSKNKVTGLLKDDLFLASKGIPHSAMAGEFLPPVYSETEYRQRLGLSDIEISKLTVAFMFINDLVCVDNWMVVSNPGTNNRVALVDVDGGSAQPRDLSGFFNQVNYVLNLGRTDHAGRIYLAFALSLNNVKQIKDILESMSKVPLEPLHESINILNPADYARLLKVLIAGADRTIEELTRAGVNPNEYLRSNNLNFARQVQEVAANHDAVFQNTTSSTPTPATATSLPLATEVASLSPSTVNRFSFTNFTAAAGKSASQAIKQSTTQAKDLIVPITAVGFALTGLFGYAFQTCRRKRKVNAIEVKADKSVKRSV